MKPFDLESKINLAVMDQSPGFFGVLSTDSKLLTVNTVGLEWIGLNDKTFVSGIGYEDLPCPVAEHANFFIWQDSLVKKNEKPVYFLGCYCYADQNWRIIFGKKYMIKGEEGEPLGIVSHFDDITSYRMADLNRFLVHSAEKSTNHNEQQFCFILEDYFQPNRLSTRELECLFFLLRGKTTKVIARILNLSPRTVESYIDQVKSKLACASKEELIEKAIHEGYQSVLPFSLLHKNIICFL